ALVTTEGFRDSLEIAYEHRFEQYDLFMQRPAPLVPRELRLTVPERTTAGGQRLRVPTEADWDALARQLERLEAESVAVGFLHSFTNPAHEVAAREALAARLPAVSVSVSHEVSPEIREYERLCTTVVNAYVRPLMSRYLERLARLLREQVGIRSPMMLMTSGGGVTDLATATRFPVRLVESGPAGGVILAAHVAAELGDDRLVAFDMGGTTAKLCLIDAGRPQQSRLFEVARSYRFQKGSGIPVRIPVIELVEIGAGGGSIASVDSMGRIAVGPESAGSQPGPACYGRGGTRPTVTDADLMLGRIDPQLFGDGELRLDAAQANEAVQRDVAAPLGLAAPVAALGISEIVDEAMASAARVHAIEEGRTLDGRTLVATGGAAPLHAARLAQKLGIDRVVVPRDAGVGSAVGFLRAPVAFQRARSLHQRLSTFDPAAVNRLIDELCTEAEGIVRSGSGGAPTTVTVLADARYVGQGHEISIEVPARRFDASSPQRLREIFDHTYRRHFSREIAGHDVELLNWTVVVTAQPTTAASDRASNAAAAPDASGTGATAAAATRILFDTALQREVEARVYPRDALSADREVPGPAVIVESQTSTVVPSDFSVRLDPHGHLVLTRRRGRHEEKSAATAENPQRGERSEDLAQIHRRVMWNRLIAVVEEQAQTLIRAAFSTAAREAGDVSAGVFDPAGRMIAQAVTGTPGHVNTMAASVSHFLARFPAHTLQDGDVLITNDPWLGTGHLFDFTVVTPAFHRGRLVALFASTTHVPDIGGRQAGPDARDVFEEGLRIPISRLASRGEMNELLLEIIRKNVRDPVQVIGDLMALVACNDTGRFRLAAMLDEFALGDLQALASHVFEATEHAMRQALAQVPAGTYRNEMTIDGYDRPVDLKLTMTVERDRIVLDFAGTSPQSPFGINVPLCYTAAYASFGIKCAIAPTVPNNAASLGFVTLSAPAGSIVNAQEPRAVTARHVIGQMLPDLVFGCLHQAKPDRVPAEGTPLWLLVLSGESPTGRFALTSFHNGGTGARPGLDGLSATSFPSGVRTVPVEIVETLSPLMFVRKELRTDSAGAGRWRGGLGQVLHLRNLSHRPFRFAAMLDRVVHPPRGRSGGADGQPGVVRTTRRRLSAMGGHEIAPDEELIIETPGGGGLGDPIMRDRSAVLDDLRQGYISAEHARRVHGIDSGTDLIQQET
ncbi:MAG TPA: hydantoinase B/oxoprolinase family protein, partial [Burkholderiaceae bacterium]|nr:hydantoinase B/oxoprolinase family protein [Burkholderiaceae bacterium]